MIGTTVAAVLHNLAVRPRKFHAVLGSMAPHAHGGRDRCLPRGSPGLLPLCE